MQFLTMCRAITYPLRTARSADLIPDDPEPRPIPSPSSSTAAPACIERDALSAEDEAAIRADLDRALDAGHAVLARGGSALDAVDAAVVVLEDSPRFNAGKGAVFNADGRHELDASLMEGHDPRAGAVAGVATIRNPILLARAVMDNRRT